MARDLTIGRPLDRNAPLCRDLRSAVEDVVDRRLFDSDSGGYCLLATEDCACPFEGRDA